MTDRTDPAAWSSSQLRQDTSHTEVDGGVDELAGRVEEAVSEEIGLGQGSVRQADAFDLHISVKLLAPPRERRSEIRLTAVPTADAVETPSSENSWMTKSKTTRAKSWISSRKRPRVGPVVIGGPP